MRSLPVAFLLCFAFVSFSAVRVLASEPQEGAALASDEGPWSRRPLAVEAHLGLWSPYGYVGAAVDYSALDYVGFTAGLGKGASGLLVGAMGRARLPIGRVAPYLELGLSLGSHQSDGCSTFDCQSGDGVWEWDVAAWGMAGVGLESRFADSFSFRLYGGAQKVLNEGSATCESLTGACGSGPNHTATEAPYVGLAMGYAF